MQGLGAVTNNQLLAIGQQPLMKLELLASPDGIDWTLRSSAADNEWRGVAYGNGLFVAVAITGVGNRVMTSPDGINWTIRTTPADNSWRSVVYGNGLFVAIAFTGVGNRVMTSPNGIDWTIRASAANNDWRDVAYGNGLFVAVANSGVGNRVMTSPNGIAWTIRVTPAADNSWVRIVYANGLFVAIAAFGVGNRVMTSTDGITWIPRVTPADNDWFGIAYGNGLFVAVAETGVGNRVMTSPNGIDWTLRVSAANNDWRAVAYGNGLFVAIAFTGVGNRVMTSPDGINWTLRVSAADNDWWSVAYGNGLFAAVAVTGTDDRVMTSPDVINFNDLAGENYVEGAGISLGGAAMTPNPVEGTWGATLFNQDGVFHPQHPTSAYNNYLETERLVRLSIGATYGGVDHYWQRIIGHMDIPKFSSPDYRVAISGGDYMKRLRDTEFRHLHNYWGASWTTSSISSDGGVGIEQYNNADAMDITGEVGLLPNWVNINVLASTFDPLADTTGGSAFVGQFITTDVYDPEYIPTVVNNNIFAPVVGKQYCLNFKYIWKAGSRARLRVRIVQLDVTLHDIALIEGLYDRAAHNDITGVTVGAPGAGDFSIDDDWTNRYLAGETFEVTDSTGNNGTYTISAGGSVFAAGITTIPVDEAVPNAVADGKIIIRGVWWDEKLYFTAVSVNPIQIWLEIYESPIGSEFWVDQFSIFEFVPYWKRYYDLRAHDANEKGVHHITLDGADVWQGEGDEGWYYTEDAEAGPDPPAHPAGIVWFDPNKTVAAGANNLIIYYYTTTAIEDVLTWILRDVGIGDKIVGAPEYVDPAVDVDKAWFEPGSNYLDAIRMICERCDYRFYFDYDGQPVFRLRPTVGGAIFTFDPKHISSIETYQSQDEIKNRIVIKGYRQAEPVSRDETRQSQLVDERADDGAGGSIELYGERTLTINNHLFQDLASITAMCISLLAEHKDPKWYSDLTIPFNPVPLEIGDSISWIERLSPTLNTAAQTGLIRDIKIDNYNVTYKCEL